MKTLFTLFIVLATNLLYASVWEFRTAKSVKELEDQNWKLFPEKGNPVSREFEGYIEYRSTFSSSDSLDHSGLYLGLIGDADKTFVNGVLVGQTGNFPPNFSYNMDTERTYFLPEGLVKVGSNSVNILVYSKFLVNKGFNPRSFKVGSISELGHVKYVDELKNNLSKIIIPVLCLVLAVVSFPLLAPKHLWNSQFMIFLIGLSSFMLGLCRGRIGYHFFSMIDTYKLTLVSSVLTIWLVTIFMTRSCKSWPRFIPTFFSAALVTAILRSNTLLETASWGRVWFHTSPIFLMTAFYGSLKVSGIKSFRTFGLVILIATNINDNLNDLRIISTFSLLQTGLGIFISSMIIDQLLGLKRSWEKFFMKEAQLEIDAELGQQAIQIAHDLRSPIEAISEGLNRISSLPKSEEHNLRMGIKRMNEICESLLNNNVSNQMPVTFNDICAAINEVVDEMKFKHATNKEIQIIYEKQQVDSTARFKLDLTKLKRSISNLIINALEATSNKGHVLISSSIEKNSLRIYVQDFGAGLPKSEHLFERGFTTKPKGNGLGLSSTKTFVEKIGGAISFESSKKGTTVVLSIPGHEFRPQIFPSHIILIDDDPLVRFNWKRQGEIANIQVDTFETFEEFLQRSEYYESNTPIYIDSNLGSQKGEILSQTLFELGFNSIYLTTGLPKKSILNTNWIKDIVGKGFNAAVIDYRDDVAAGLMNISLDADKLGAPKL